MKLFRRRCLYNHFFSIRPIMRWPRLPIFTKQPRSNCENLLQMEFLRRFVLWNRCGGVMGSVDLAHQKNPCSKWQTSSKIILLNYYFVGKYYIDRLSLKLAASCEVSVFFLKVSNLVCLQWCLILWYHFGNQCKVRISCTFGNASA